jgi:hypothetical protein
MYNGPGLELTTLVEGEEVAAYHEVPFDARGPAGEVSFYRLEAGDFIFQSQRAEQSILP